MLSDSDKREILEKILQSTEFEHSRKNSTLLTYLVESSIKNVSPKETSIAFDVFGKDADFNPNEDTSIRVNVHHLRKKLEKYYQREGKTDKVRVDIPLGHYEVRFVTPSKTQSFIAKNSRSLFEIILVFIIIILGGYLIINSQITHDEMVKNVHDISPEMDLMWADILNSQLPILVVLGEIFWFLEYDTDINSWVRMIQSDITTVNDLNEFQNTFPNKQIRYDNSTPPYFAMNSVWALPDLLPILISGKKQFRLERSSVLTPRDLKENNIIFIGYYKSLGIFEQAMQKLNYYFIKDEDAISIKSSSADSMFKVFREGTAKGYHEDYCIVQKVPGPKENSIFIFSSFRATGVRGAAEYLTKTESVSHLEKLFSEKFGKFPHYFELLFKVSGYDRSDLSTEIMEFNLVDPNVSLW